MWGSFLHCRQIYSLADMNYRTKLLFLQAAFGLLFLTFGVGKIIEPSTWIAMVPTWAKSGIPLDIDTWMYYAGIIEIIIGIWIVIPLKAHFAALAGFLYYIPWVIFAGIGYLGVKDISILIALFALVLLSWPKEYKLSFDE